MESQAVALADADRPYRGALDALAPALFESYRRVLAKGPLPLEGTEVTEALLLRIGAFYDAQGTIKHELKKRYMGAGATSWLNLFCSFLRSLAETHRLEVDMHAERAVERRRGAMKPDITIWRDDRCLAFIECKTQLGWDRNEWKAKFAERGRRFRETTPSGRGFLVVLTTLNWPGFDPDDPELGRTYFALFHKWPSTYELGELRSLIENPIEGLLRQVVELAREGSALAAPESTAVTA
jgi:hypothetical protein